MKPLKTDYTTENSIVASVVSISGRDRQATGQFTRRFFYGLGNDFRGDSGSIYFRPLYSPGLPQLYHQAHQGPITYVFVFCFRSIGIPNALRYSQAG
jgi:hypothetical protein